MKNGVHSSWFIPLQTNSTIDDILLLFAQYLMTRDGGLPEFTQYPLLKMCFEALLTEENECMFVFMRRGTHNAAGILRSVKPLCSAREQTLMAQLGISNQWNVPLWTWKESNPTMQWEMEKQCPDQKLYMGIWCYR